MFLHCLVDIRAAFKVEIKVVEKLV